MKPLLNGLKFPLGIAAVISIGVNLLMMVSPIFMMQVFDRVLMSGHLETLYGLTAIAFIALALLGIFDALRQQVLSRAGDWLEHEAGNALIDAALARKVPAQETFQHIESVKRFFCAQGVFSLLDAPWLIVFGAVLYWMHPWLGGAAITGALILLAIALITEMASRKPLTDASKHKQTTQAILSSALRNSDTVRAMGMSSRIKSRWQDATGSAMTRNAVASERSAALSGLAKSMRMIIQTVVLAIGALLVLDGQLSAGGMIAASMLLGRCLAPVEQAIGAWKVFVMARNSWKRLAAIDCKMDRQDYMTLPDPEGHLAVSNLSWQPDEDRPAILQDISFKMAPGQVLVLIGSSGSGKTSLCRLLVGAHTPSMGDITLDDRPITGWNPDQLGHFIGFMPQGVELLPGSLKDNIQRFGEDDPEGVVEAAQKAGIDELIRNLPEGYDSQYDMFEKPILSAGQLQRVGLARALYGNPKLVVLDEPNANLDVNGEKALSQSVRKMADSGAAVVVVTHRPAMLGVADLVGIMKDGSLAQFGPREDILKPAEARPRPSPDKVASVTPLDWSSASKALKPGHI